jgi:hypothetical protein
MMSDALAQLLRRFLLGQRLVWAGYTAAIPLYGVMTGVVLSLQGGVAGEVSGTLALALALAGILSAGASVYYRKWSLSNARLARPLIRR